MAFRRLTPAEERVIVHRGTEEPFTGEYERHFEPGTYRCRRCGAPLYRSSDKFDAGCGWPSFDAEIEGAVTRGMDADGVRTEITCSACGGHLGHLFEGERLTPRNTRHCVNSISLVFEPEAGRREGAVPDGEGGIAGEAAPANRGAADAPERAEEIALGGGCFWCTEAVLGEVEGVLAVTPGYAGGTTVDPTYEQVCGGETGHAEVVLVGFDPRKVSLETILDLFFATHDPTSLDRQGADVGTQYRSAIYYTSEGQGDRVARFVERASGEYGKPIVTEVAALRAFYPAEEYHRRYFEANPLDRYCRAVIAPKVETARRKLGKAG